ncbi:hypothetical protein J6590_021159 [Homalodisca vitripennis]|nr:hypothetical protein J6590_021159 [Homalodisca vitripennis]
MANYGRSVELSRFGKVTIASGMHLIPAAGILQFEKSDRAFIIVDVSRSGRSTLTYSL